MLPVRRENGRLCRLCNVVGLCTLGYLITFILWVKWFLTVGYYAIQFVPYLHYIQIIRIVAQFDFMDYFKFKPIILLFNNVLNQNFSSITLTFVIINIDPHLFCIKYLNIYYNSSFLECIDINFHLQLYMVNLCSLLFCSTLI